MKKLQDLVWLWMLLAFTIVPAARQWLVGIRRKVLIAKVERVRGTKVITNGWQFHNLPAWNPETLVG